MYLVLKKKYYVGAKHIGHAVGKGNETVCQRASLEEAITEAKQMMLEDNNIESLVIVKIVALVKKDFPPVRVEVVE